MSYVAVGTAVAGAVVSSQSKDGGGGGGGAPAMPSNLKFGPVAFKSSGTGNTAKNGGKNKSGAAGNSGSSIMPDLKGVPVWAIPAALIIAAAYLLTGLFRRK